MDSRNDLEPLSGNCLTLSYSEQYEKKSAAIGSMVTRINKKVEAFFIFPLAKLRCPNYCCKRGLRYQYTEIPIAVPTIFYIDMEVQSDIRIISEAK